MPSASVTMVDWILLHWSGVWRRLIEEMVSDGQHPDMQAVVDQAPQTARQEEREGDGDQAQADQIPGPKVSELILDNEEQDRSDDWPFERA